MPRSTVTRRGRLKLEPPSPEVALRELMAVREIVHAFLNAERPEEVYQFALDRVGPIVGASFASIYLVDGVSELMRLGAAFNWPEKHRPWLGEMRVRLGFGPSGEAASERRVIEVPDVFADDDLEDWQEVANELGFRSITALPLHGGSRTLGAVTFYFSEVGALSPEKRGLLRIVADQLAATAEKALLIEELRRTNSALVESNAELERQYLEVVDARRAKDEFLANISHELRTPLTAMLGYLAILQEGISGPLTDGQRTDLTQCRRSSERLLELIEDLLEMTTLSVGAAGVQVGDFDPWEPVAELAADAHELRDGVTLRFDPPATGSPLMHGDRRRIVRILGILLNNAIKFTEQGEITVSLQVRNDRVAWRVQDTGIGIPAEAQRVVFDEFRQADGSVTRRYSGSGIGLALARRMARLLGGDIDLYSVPGEGSTFTLELPLHCETTTTVHADT
ncbi:MAG TPA: GAF domain-containing sensor histidine kinase [Gemmatimonadaceae bacterium]|nr:GAF domain-containing sensor histidine kinase [Gemmatimonadaceae bacterium]